jgi:hypothetical protein
VLVVRSDFYVALGGRSAIVAEGRYETNNQSSLLESEMNSAGGMGATPGLVSRLKMMYITNLKFSS